MSPFHGFAWRKKTISMNSSMKRRTACMKNLICGTCLNFSFSLRYECTTQHIVRQYIINWSATQCGILTSVDSDEHVQPPFKLTNSKRCSVSSLTLIEYSSNYQRLWSDCAYAQADLRLCWLLEISCHGSIIFFRDIGRKVERSLTWLIIGILFAPDMIWQDVGDLLDPNYLQT